MSSRTCFSAITSNLLLGFSENLRGQNPMFARTLLAAEMGKSPCRSKAARTPITVQFGFVVISRNIFITLGVHMAKLLSTSLSPENRLESLSRNGSRQIKRSDPKCQ